MGKTMREYWNPEIELLSRGEIKELQEKRLKKQIKYIFSNSTFYRKKLRQAGISPEDIKTVKDLQKIPITTKEELRESQAKRPPFGEQLCVSRNKIKWIATTSGTTGVPLVLPRSHEDIDTWANLMARAYICHGVGTGDIVQNTFNYSYFHGSLMVHLGAQRAGATVINSGTGNTERQIFTLQFFQTTVLAGTCSYLLYLGRKIREMGVDPLRLRLKVIVAGGEIGAGSLSCKERFKKIFPTLRHVLDQYGITDIGTPIAAECTEEEGMHIFEDAVIVEILDPETGKLLSPGKVGEVVLTDLLSKTAPLLRFRTGDLATVDITPCRCQRSFLKFQGGILGRADDMFTVRGVNVFPAAIESLIKEIDELTGEYQLIVDRPDDLDVLIVRAEYKKGIENLNGLRERIKKAIRGNLGLRAKVELLPAGDLPCFITKAIRIIDKRKGEDLQKIAKKVELQDKLD